MLGFTLCPAPHFGVFVQMSSHVVGHHSFPAGIFAGAFLVHAQPQSFGLNSCPAGHFLVSLHLHAHCSGSKICGRLHFKVCAHPQQHDESKNTCLPVHFVFDLLGHSQVHELSLKA